MSRQPASPWAAAPLDEDDDAMFTQHRGILSMDRLTFSERLHRARQLDALLDSFESSDEEGNGDTLSSINVRGTVAVAASRALEDMASAATTRVGSVAESVCPSTAGTSSDGTAEHTGTEALYSPTDSGVSARVASANAPGAVAAHASGARPGSLPRIGGRGSGRKVRTPAGPREPAVPAANYGY